ncbi:MAG TPA: crotonase/enoyl-CoA hydratase family protein [Acidimicrobiia bacterium]|nr:crotonase/enoyl-CoA hydratase family protein [Acidimicrobiia bacterium]
MSVDYERRGRVAVITIDRADVRNAIDRATARALGDAWRTFDSDARVDVGVLYGAGGHFSAGADLKAFDLVDDRAGYLGFTRMHVSKPTIAAIEGYCVAGGLEMALWCDLRLASNTAVFGCLERRFGVPLVDGGTVRLPRVVGVGVALEMVLTGREMTADEAYVVGLVNGVVQEGTSLAKAVGLAESIAVHPQQTVRSDRAALLGGLGLGDTEALELERRLGAAVMDVAAAGADRFAAGAGRSGAAIPQVFAATSASEERPTSRSDPRLSPPPAGHGRPMIVVATEDEEGWREDVVRRLHGLGYVTYDVIASGTLEADLDALGRAVAAVLGSANVLGDRVGLVALGKGAPAALHFSTMDGRIGAVVEFSGRAPESTPSFRLAGASYLGHHGGGGDGEISPFSMESHMRDLGVDATFHSYRGAAPDFFVEGSSGHHPTFTDAAWQRTRLFLERAI